MTEIRVGKKLSSADLNFNAPVVISTSNLPGDTKVGTIVYQASDNNFYGLQNLGGIVSWVALNAPSGGGFVPVGTVLPFAGTTAPTGYLLCDGSSYLKTAYPNLATAVGVSFGGTSTNFNVPDLRGKFIRGVDNGAGTDPDTGSRTAMASGGNTGDAIGSIQSDALQGHYHNVTDPGHSHTTTGQLSVNTGGGPAVPTQSMVGSAFATNSATTGITVTAPTSDGMHGPTVRTAFETRPANAYLNYIIKY